MIKRYIPAVSLILLGITLVALIIPAFFARFMADDYCMNAGAQNASFTVFFNSVYTSWSGRFAYIASTYFLSRITAQSFGFLVAMVVLTWFCVLAKSLKVGSQLFKIKINWIESLTLAAILLIAVFKTAPNLYQDLYWRDGLVNYIVPLVFTSLSLTFIANVLQSRLTFPKALGLGFAAFLSAGFSESASIANLTFWSALCILNIFSKHPKKIAVLMTFGIPALGALVGFLIEFFAPGNLVRSGILPDRPGLFELAGLTLRNVAHLYGRLLILNFFWALLCLLMGLYLGYAANIKTVRTFADRDKIPMRNWFVGAALSNFMLGSGVCAAVAYLMKAYPDERIVIIPYFFALLTILMTGLRVGSWLSLRKSASDNSLKRRNSFEFAPYAFIALAVGLGFSFTANLRKTLPNLTEYARRWDARDAQIRAELVAGKKDLIIPGLESRFGLPDLQLEKDDWVNNCTAAYYGANSITGR